MARVLDAGVRPAALASVPGVTFRSGTGRIVRNPDAPLIDLDQVPFPAFHLIGGVGWASYVSLEIGRGCPFSCTFCSTSSFFRRRFRLKSPAAAIGQMKRLKREYGVDVLALVHDMFTVDRRRVVEFCKALLDSGERFRWTCSGRTDSIDEELLELMQAAGCCGLFLGSRPALRACKKPFGRTCGFRRHRPVWRAPPGPAWNQPCLSSPGSRRKLRKTWLRRLRS